MNYHPSISHWVGKNTFSIQFTLVVVLKSISVLEMRGADAIHLHSVTIKYSPYPIQCYDLNPEAGLYNNTNTVL